jgi:hypothetical protein
MTAVGKQEFDFPGDTIIEEQFHSNRDLGTNFRWALPASASSKRVSYVGNRNSDVARVEVEEHEISNADNTVR